MMKNRSYLRRNLICFPLGYGFTITLNLASNLPLEWQYLMGLLHPLIAPLKSFPTFFKVNHMDITLAHMGITLAHMGIFTCILSF